MPARFDACSTVIAQMFPSASTSRRVFSSRSRVSTTGVLRNSMYNVSVSVKYRIFMLDVADVPKKHTAPLNPEQQHRELLMFSILISIMERAYLMYQDKSDAVRRSQWEGWSAYIVDWSRRPNFKLVAPALSQQFDRRFCEYLHDVIKMSPTATA